MTDKHIDSVLSIIDGGLQQTLNHRPGVKPDKCVRENCGRPATAGHAFCSPCYAWVACETDHDPCPTDMPRPAPPAPPVPDSYNPEPEPSYDWVEFCGDGWD